MSRTEQTPMDQKTLWNGPGGEAWVREQAVMDTMLRPFETLLADVAAGGAQRVLDVGCGTGSTTLAMAERVGAAGQCLGVDISEPMITAACARAAATGSRAQFACADAEDYPFAAGSVDLVASRFGIMFFRNPVAAFANLRRAAAGGGRLHALAWRSPADNPFMTTAERTAARLLPDFPKRAPDGPGQFAFADADHVHGILGQAGWQDADLQPADVDCAFPEASLDRFLMRMGPLGLLLANADDVTRAQVTKAVRAAFEPYITGDAVTFTAACWVITARAA